MLDTTMTIKDLNDLFKNLRKYKVAMKDGHQGVPEDDDGDGGEYNEQFHYYRHPSMPVNLFLQETQQSDSYGNFDNADKTYSFVEGKEKTVTVYEPI